MANYNWPSGYGSQASIVQDDVTYNSIDTSTKKDSEAYVHRGAMKPTFIMHIMKDKIKTV